MSEWICKNSISTNSIKSIDLLEKAVITNCVLCFMEITPLGNRLIVRNDEHILSQGQSLRSQRNDSQPNL
jgi:hypothetical protein